jgi:hypothetical protein
MQIQNLTLMSEKGKSHTGPSAAPFHQTELRVSNDWGQTGRAIDWKQQ